MIFFTVWLLSLYYFFYRQCSYFQRILFSGKSFVTGNSGYIFLMNKNFVIYQYIISPA